MSTSPLQHLYKEELYVVAPKVLVVIAKPWIAVSEEERTTLSNMLGAVNKRLGVNVSLATVQIHVSQSFTLDDLAVFAPEKIIAFGATLEPRVNPYVCSKVKTTSVIVSDALESLDDAKKKSLWAALQVMFAAS